MIALLWLILWEACLLMLSLGFLPDPRLSGLLLFLMLVLGLGVAWFGCVGREINRIAWMVTIGGYLASSSRYLNEAGHYARALDMPISDVFMLTIWLGIPIAWAMHPILAGAEWGIGKVRERDQSTRRTARRSRRRYLRRR